MRKILLVLGLMLVLGACSGSAGNTNAADTADTADNTAIGRYWDFEDVLVPSSMKLEKDKSMIFNTEGHRGGLLVFSDNLELTSLVNFFTANMSKDNWLHKASFKYPSVAMFFAKPDRTCIIQINESTFSTQVTIWVAPTAGVKP